MKLTTIRKWKRDALEMAHDLKSGHYYSPNQIRLCERLAEVCSVLERRMKEQEGDKEGD